MTDISDENDNIQFLIDNILMELSQQLTDSRNQNLDRLYQLYGQKVPVELKVIIDNNRFFANLDFVTNRNKQATFDSLLYIFYNRKQAASVRGLAIDALHKLDKEKTLKHLLANLNDEESFVRQIIVISLGDCKNSEATKALLKLAIEDGSSDVRAYCIMSLSSKNHEEQIIRELNELLVNSLTELDKKFFAFVLLFAGITPNKKIVHKIETVLVNNLTKKQKENSRFILQQMQQDFQYSEPLLARLLNLF